MPEPGGHARRPLLALLVAQGISLTGSQLTVVALPWFALQTTGSATKTGLTGVAATVPVALAALVGGQVVDRLGARRVSIAADLAGGLALAAIPALYHTVGLAFWQLLALVFAGRLLTVPGATARDSLLPDLLAAAALPPERVNAAAQATRNAAQLLGPPLAGVLIAATGASVALGLDAASFVLSAWIVAAAVARRTPVAASGAAAYPEQAVEATAVAGWKFLGRDRLLLTVALAGTVVNAVGAPLGAVVLPVYAARALDSPVALGLLFAALGGGTLGGALLFVALGARLPRRRIYALAYLALALSSWVLVPLPGLPVALAALAAMGLAVGPLNPLIATVEQERIPAALRGRVFGAIAAVANVATPLGILAASAAIERAGLQVTLLGLAALLSAVAVQAFANPALRALARPARIAPSPRRPNPREPSP